MNRPLRVAVRVLVILIVLTVAVYLVMLGILIWKVHHVPAAGEYDAIVILGSQVRRDGTPNVQLQWRLDKGLEIWQSRPCPVVVCGARGSDEPRPEAEVMADYLTDRDYFDANRSRFEGGGEGRSVFIPADQVLADPASFNTRQNLQNATRLLREHGCDVKRVLIITSDYHLPRALALAEDEGVEACGVGSPILGGWNTVRNYARETVAWLKYLAERTFGFRMVVDSASLSGREVGRPEP